MLWWIPELNKGSVLPQNSTYLSGFNMSLNMGATVTEAVGVEPTVKYMGGNATSTIKRRTRERPMQMSAEGAKMVEERMETAGIRLPEGREILGKEDIGTDIQNLSKSPVEIRHQSVQEVIQAMEDFKTRSQEILETQRTLTASKKHAKLRKEVAKWDKEIEYPQCRWAVLEPRPGFWREGQLQSNGGLTGAAMKTALFMDMNLRLINLEAHVKALEEKGHDITALKVEVLKLGTEFRLECLEENGPSMQDSLDSLLEDQLGFHASPQVVPFDRRAYEPIKAEPEDFWPKEALCLLDVTPVTRDLAVPELANRREGVLTAQELIKHLFQQKVTSVPFALDSLAPNAAQDLIPMVQSITDPRKGGRLDPSMVKVRMLTDDMIEGLVKAWFEWPFRPTQWQLALAAGGGLGSDSSHAEVAMTPEGVSDM